MLRFPRPCFRTPRVRRFGGSVGLGDAEVGEGAWNVQGEKLTWRQHALAVYTAVVHVSLSKRLRRDDDIGLVRTSQVDRVGEGRAVRRRGSRWAGRRFGRRGKGDASGGFGRTSVGLGIINREFRWRSYGRRDDIEDGLVATVLVFGWTWGLFDQRPVGLRRGRLVDGALVGRGDTLCVFGILALPASTHPEEFTPKCGVENQEET